MAGSANEPENDTNVISRSTDCVAYAFKIGVFHFTKDFIMKVRFYSTLLMVLAGAGSSTLSMAQMDHSNMKAAPVAAATPKANEVMVDGLVKKVDKTKGTVTLAHGAMNGMPPMTMAYKVKDSAWLEKLQVGQKIRFSTDPSDGGMTLAKIDLVK